MKLVRFGTAGREKPGLGMQPSPPFLKAGDVVRPGVEGLGEQCQKVMAS